MQDLAPNFPVLYKTMTPLTVPKLHFNKKIKSDIYCRPTDKHFIRIHLVFSYDIDFLDYLASFLLRKE